MIRAGLLDETADVLRYVRSTDRFGADTGSWQTVADGVPCSVRDKARGYGAENGEVVYTHVTEFQMRYTDAVREYDRLLWDGRIYQVEGIDRSRRRYGEMMVTGHFVDYQDSASDGQ